MIAEIAFSLVLLVGAGLLLRGFFKLIHTDPGFRPEHVLTAWIPVGENVAKDKALLTRRYAAIVQTAAKMMTTAATSKNPMIVSPRCARA